MGGTTGVDAQRTGKQPDVQRQQVEQVFHSLTSGTDLEQVEPRELFSFPLCSIEFLTDLV